MMKAWRLAAVCLGVLALMFIVAFFQVSRERITPQPSIVIPVAEASDTKYFNCTRELVKWKRPAGTLDFMPVPTYRGDAERITLFLCEDGTVVGRIETLTVVATEQEP